MNLWEESVEKRNGDFTPAQKNMMLLSRETRKGLKLTGNNGVHNAHAIIGIKIHSYITLTVSSFVDVTVVLLGIPGVTYTSSASVFVKTLLKHSLGSRDTRVVKVTTHL